MRTLQKSVGVAGLALLFGAVAFGQAKPEVKAEVKPDAKAQVDLDHGFATCLSYAAYNEIELAKFAESKTRNEEVKRFAAMLVKEHTQCMQELEAFRAKHADAKPQPSEKAVWMTIQKEMSAQCLGSSKRELDRHEGRNFDQAYLGLALVSHIKAHDTLTVFQKHAVSPELKATIAKGLETTAAHEKEVRRLMENLSTKTAAKE